MISAIRTISLAGAALFALVLVLALFAPGQIETRAKAFIVAKVQEKSALAWQESDSAEAKEKLDELRQRLGLRGEEELRDALAEYLSRYIATLCHLDCPKQEKLRAFLSKNLEVVWNQAGQLVEKAKIWAKDRYAAVTDKLLRDFRIFAGSNLALFLITFALTFLRASSARELALPAGLLLAATLIAAGVYLFGQNWFFTILYDRYWGYGYLGFVGLVLLFLLDICYLRGQASASILDGVSSAFAKICG